MRWDSTTWTEPQRLGVIALCTLLCCTLVYFVDPTQSTLVPCVFHKITGLSCPGCGMTRAAHCLLHAQWHQAWLWNPLSYAVLPLITLSYLQRCLRAAGWTKSRFPFNSQPLQILALVVVLGFMLWRNV